ncbi:MAG: hypothetical protein ABEK84_08785 [Salinibacter sp.]
MLPFPGSLKRDLILRRRGVGGRHVGGLQRHAPVGHRHALVAERRFPLQLCELAVLDLPERHRDPRNAGRPREGEGPLRRAKHVLVKLSLGRQGHEHAAAVLLDGEGDGSAQEFERFLHGAVGLEVAVGLVHLLKLHDHLLHLLVLGVRRAGGPEYEQGAGEHDEEAPDERRKPEDGVQRGGEHRRRIASHGSERVMSEDDEKTDKNGRGETGIYRLVFLPAFLFRRRFVGDFRPIVTDGSPRLGLSPQITFFRGSREVPAPSGA